APASPRLCAHSQLRLSGQPPARSIATTLYSLTGLGEPTRPSSFACYAPCPRTYSLDLPPLRWTDARDREAFCCPDSTPRSAASTGVRRMKPQLLPRPIFVLRHAPDFCVARAPSQVSSLTARAIPRALLTQELDATSNPTTPSHSGTGLPPS